MRDRTLSGAGGMQPQLEQPLSPEERAQAEQVAHRLHDELRGILARLPEHVRGGSAVSRHLGLHRATCQRIVGAAGEAHPGVELLTRVPGVQGLRQFLEAAEKKGVAKGDLAGAEAAVDQFDELLERIGGSQSRLASRLEAAPAAGAGEPSRKELVRHRRALFEAAAVLAGRSSALGLTIYGYRPDPEDPERIESFTVSGYIGHVANAEAVPFTVLAGSVPTNEPVAEEEGRFAFLDRSPAVGRTPRAVLEEFSTSPLPMVTSRGPGGMLLQVIDPKATLASEPFDLVTAHRPARSAPHPATEDPPVQESWSLQSYPARHMVFDVWLHEDLARRCIPSADLHLHLPMFERLLGNRWMSRFPHGPRLELLGRGMRNAVTPHYERMGDLVGGVFERLGWDLEGFVGHRCDVSHPLWRSGYCISFDFSDEAAG